MRLRVTLGMAVLAAGFVGLPARSDARPGERDPGFGMDGTISLSMNARNGVRLVADRQDRLLAAGWEENTAVIRRFRPDGSADDGFGVAGRADLGQMEGLDCAG